MLKVEKLFYIYVWEYLNRDNKEFFYCLLKDITKIGSRDFADYTESENKDFLFKWKKENDIHITDYKFVKKPKLNKDLVPEYIKMNVNYINKEIKFD